MRRFSDFPSPLNTPHKRKNSCKEIFKNKIPPTSLSAICEKNELNDIYIMNDDPPLKKLIAK